MKAKIIIFLVLLSLTPMIYAQEEALEARKASLELNANNFLLQMDFVIDFSRNKSIDVKDLTEIKSGFEAELYEALAAKTIDELKAKEKEMKDLAKQFKEITKTKFKDYIGGLKVELYKLKKVNKEKFKEKINKLNQERRKLVSIAYDKRILQINLKIEEDKKAGKESRIQNILLEKFEKAKTKLNETDFTEQELSISSGSILSKTTGAIKDIFGFLKDKIKMIGEAE